MRKIWIGALIFTGAAIFISFAIMLMIYFTPKPPVEEMEYARVTISMAGRVKADDYSKNIYTEANNLYDSAMATWQKENERFLYNRDYKRVVMYAEISAKKALEASENSVRSSSNLEIKLTQKITFLNELISDLSESFYTYPLSFEIRDRISRGKLLLKEAEIAYNDQKYLQANIKISDAENLLTSSYSNATKNLTIYFQSYPVWKNWINKTISDSKKNRDYSIIIDKFSRRCFIYLNGTKKYEFEAELGRNWVGDKRMMGDKATPEGMYKIIKKMDGNMTIYYKALLLDYPNGEDIAKFKSEIERGSLPPTAKIGNMIEIHGNGGKGIDWTDGCIAIADKDMDILFWIAKVGTPVTIVGSMTDLQYVPVKKAI
jgi:hypothetical protein